MIFTPEQIQELVQILESQTLLFIGQNLGTKVLSDQDKAVLKKSGIEIEEIEGIDYTEISFKFGLVSQSLSDSTVKNMKWKDFKKFVVSGKYLPLTPQEEEVVNILKNKTYNHIKGLGDKIVNDLRQEIVEASLRERVRKENAIKEELSQGVVERKSIQEIVSNLQMRIKDYQRDFSRIVETELQNSFEEGRAAMIKRENPDRDPEVYKDVYPGACHQCIKAYLTNGIGSKPRVFKLSELQANGTNIGKKQSEWKPVVGAMHPYCFSDDTEVLTKRGWRLFKDVTLEDLFLSVNLETEDAEWCKAIRKIEYFYSGEMHSVKSRDFDLLTTLDHRHVVKLDEWKQARLVSGQKLPKNSRFLRTIPNWKGEFSENVKIDGKEYDSKLWFEFMGWYLSEGSISKYTESHYEINITQLKVKYRKEIEEVCRKLFSKVWVGKQDIVIPIDIGKGYSSKFVQHFKGLGHARDKYVPEYIKESSRELIEIFLLSFCKGNGTFDKPTFFENHQFNGLRIFYTSSDQLASDLGELILKIGRRPSYFRHKDTWAISENNNQYACRISSSTGDRLKIVNYEGMVYDVELEKLHTLIVRRNGKVWVSGNCRCTLNEKEEDREWDDETKSFSKLKPREERQRKIKRQRVRVEIGGKEYMV